MRQGRKIVRLAGLDGTLLVPIAGCKKGPTVGTEVDVPVVVMPLEGGG